MRAQLLCCNNNRNTCAIVHQQRNMNMFRDACRIKADSNTFKGRKGEAGMVATTHQESFFAVLSPVLQCEVAVLVCMLHSMYTLHIRDHHMYMYHI